MLYKSLAFWLWGFIPPPIIVLVCFLIQRRRLRFKHDIRFARHRRAVKIALQEFKSCERLLKQEKSREFYIGISKALNHYLADKFNRSSASISPEIVDELMDKGIEEGILKDLRTCYEQCALVKFSKIASDQKEMQRLFNVTKGLISKLEKVL